MWSAVINGVEVFRVSFLHCPHPCKLHARGCDHTRNIFGRGGSASSSVRCVSAAILAAFQTQSCLIHLSSLRIHHPVTPPPPADATAATAAAAANANADAAAANANADAAANLRALPELRPVVAATAAAVARAAVWTANISDLTITKETPTTTRWPLKVTVIAKGGLPPGPFAENETERGERDERNKETAHRSANGYGIALVDLGGVVIGGERATGRSISGKAPILLLL
jgi:hypothetical protein